MDSLQVYQRDRLVLDLDQMLTPDVVQAGLAVLRQSGVVDIPLDSDELLVAEIFATMLTRAHATGIFQTA